VLIGVLGLFVIGYLLESVLGVLMGGAGARAQEARLEETVLENNHSGNKIAVVSIDGIIMSLDRGPHNLVHLVKDQLKSAKEDERVKAVILKVDSPGGEVLASDDIARALAKFQKESGKPVIASMASVAASGGYYVSAPCRWIVANELTITGSIGVIMQSYNFRGLMDKIGLRPETFKSGKYKDMLSATKPESEITQEERDMVQKLVNETFEKFKSVVAEGRKQASEKNKAAPEPGRVLDAKWADYVDGRILSGKQAYELGFVDELGPFESAVDRAKKIAGIKDANLVQFQPVFDLSSLFRMFGRADVGRVKVDLGLEVPQLRAGYLYFLAPNYVH
jgi:protease-4